MPVLRGAFVLGGLLFALAGCATGGAPMASPSTAVDHVELEDLRLDLPGAGWRRALLPSGVQLVRAYGARESVGLAIRVVQVPMSLRGLAPAEHAARYFAAERDAERPSWRWHDFLEGVREVAGVAYPAMIARFTARHGDRQGDGLFLLFFPGDFPLRQRFYVLLWSDVHPAGQPGRDLADLDAALTSLRVRPVKMVVSAE